jgi:hypothetical protein
MGGAGPRAITHSCVPEMGRTGSWGLRGREDAGDWQAPDVQDLAPHPQALIGIHHFAAVTVSELAEYLIYRISVNRIPALNLYPKPKPQTLVHRPCRRAAQNHANHKRPHPAVVYALRLDFKIYDCKK